ncbi:hypothetical protein MTO96_025731 [Rhipicephalus appendiculatus]
MASLMTSKFLRAARNSQILAPFSRGRVRAADQSADVSRFTRLLSVSASARSKFLFRQLFDEASWTYTYLLADLNTKEALLIDPVLEQVERDAKLINELEIRLIYAVNTHAHADHITGSGKLKGLFKGCRSVISTASGARADKLINHGDVFGFGCVQLEARATPGHTKGCMTYVWHDRRKAFTGDALLIRGCGRTDLQGGDPMQLYDSVHSQIFSLPIEYSLYPAHDYKGMTVTTVAEELKYNSSADKDEGGVRGNNENPQHELSQDDG